MNPAPWGDFRCSLLMLRLPGSVRLLRGVLLVAGLCAPSFLPCGAAEPSLPPQLKARVDDSLKRGIEALRKVAPSPGSGQQSLIAYALLKAKTPADHPVIVAQREAVLAKIAGGSYRPGRHPPHHAYEAGCDAMFLEALDPAAYQQQLIEIRDYLVATQRDSGAWDYPATSMQPSGDTSITQYGILGLWAVHRAGIPVEATVWSRAAKYHEATQASDGGFSYHPYEAGQNPQHTTATASMTAAGMGSTLITELILYGDPTNSRAAERPRRRFGVLELRPETDEPTQVLAPKKPGDAVISREALRKIIPAAERSVGRRFEEGLKGTYPVYFLYGCERSGAISQKEQFGDVPWYERGCEYLLMTQLPDGTWGASAAFPPGVDTAFAVLFLSRATQSLIPVRPKRPVGAGLLVGGRGLPSDLKAVQVQDGVVDKGPQSALNDLLKDLEAPEQVNLPVVQQQLEELVDLDQPEKLVGQLERLQRLLRHPQPEVRQVAVWALARSNDLRQTPRLLQMLKDPDIVVAWEASLGLCYLSRMPMGLQPDNRQTPLPVNPPGVLSTEEPAAELAQQQSAWRAQAFAAWDAWYQQVRPYDERDDQRQFQKK